MPEIAFAILVSAERLYVRLVLLAKVTAPVPNVPVVPASPICNVPALMAVVPA